MRSLGYRRPYVAVRIFRVPLETRSTRSLRVSARVFGYFHGLERISTVYRFAQSTPMADLQSHGVRRIQQKPLQYNHELLANMAASTANFDVP